MSAIAAAGLLAGCAAARAPLDLPRTPEVADGAWPRLADAPPAESSAEGAPAPAEGRAIAESLSLDAAAGAAEAERLGASPVVDLGESARLRRAADG
jgi:hypothetical protein